MPKTIFFCLIIFIKFFRLISYFIKGVQKKSTTTASGVKYKVIIIYIHHSDGEAHNFTRSKILSAYTFEKSFHELFKSNAFDIKIGFI